VWFLGIETSGQTGSVALFCDDELFAERQLATAGRRHAQTLLSEIQELLQAAAVPPAAVNAVAVSLGPGSFTGLRVGVVCAKTWSYATGCRIVGIETFAGFASQSPPDWSQTWVIADAQRGDYFAAEYRRDAKGEWCTTAEVAIVPGVSWLASRTPAEHIVGPGASRIAEGATPAHVVRDEWATRPSAAAIARLGRQRLLCGDADDPWTLSPVYIRPSAAEEKHGRPATAQDSGLLM
jgi:tRNA threonylcarbamoyladenosine biosynthesis protein TsaB